MIRGVCRNHEGTKNTKTHEEFLYNKIFVDLRAFVSSWLRTRDSERAVWPNREARVIRGACRNHEGTKNTKTHEEFLYKKIFVDLRAFVSSWLRTRDSERAAWPRR